MPLAPGYQVEKESLTVRFVPATPPHLAVRAVYQLKNVGTTPLDSIEVTVPREKSFGCSNLRVLVASREVAPQAEQDPDSPSASDQSGGAESLWRIPLTPALRKKQKINVRLEYDLAAAAPTDPRIFAVENMFYLNDSGWFPEFQEPKALFAEDITRPNPTDFTVIVPPNFAITASGQSRGEKKLSAETEHRFRISKDDFDPFVLAGQYHQQIVSSAGAVTVAIWTLKPIPAAQAQQTAAQIAAVAHFYSQNFGPLPKSVSTIYYADFAPEAGKQIKSGDSGRPSLPPTVIGTASENSFARMDLAHTWFAHVIVPNPEAWMLAQGFDFYASVLSNAGKNPTENSGVTAILSDFDAQRSQGVEKPLAFLTPRDPQVQLQVGLDKMRLFFFALQDQCGRENLIHAMHHMVYALHGQQYGYNDFRAALEQECHQNLAGFFRTWLTQPGIPPDFRARYQPSAPKQ